MSSAGGGQDIQAIQSLHDSMKRPPSANLKKGNSYIIKIGFRDVNKHSLSKESGSRGPGFGLPLEGGVFTQSRTS